MMMINDAWFKNLISEDTLFWSYRDYLHDANSGWELYLMDDEVTDTAFPHLSYGDLFRLVKESEKINFDHPYLLIGDDLEDSYSIEEGKLHQEVLDHMSVILAHLVCIALYPDNYEKGQDLFEMAEEFCSGTDLVTTGDYDKDKGTDILIVASVLKKLDDEKTLNEEEEE